MSETILTAENLKFRYDPEQPVYALDGVSASVKRGEFVAVLGANGCGKSTLAKHFNAILLPEAGTVLVEGMDTADESKIYDIRQTVGMVFQNPDNQIVATKEVLVGGEKVVIVDKALLQLIVHLQWGGREILAATCRLRLISKLLRAWSMNSFA